jgi:hypothetical protein
MIAFDPEGDLTMTNDKGASVELLADHFVNYLFDTYQGTRHVRGVATWIGFLLKGLENLPGSQLQQSRERQVRFDYANRRFKARYNHTVGTRGGIEIIEVLPGRGQPEGEVAVQITNLHEAEEVYRNLRSRLDAFITNHPR